jgi:Holliday junction resolvase
MANPSKQKGTTAETKVVKYLTARGLRAERRPLAGSSDNGYLRLILPDETEVTVEVKCGRQTQGYSRSSIEDWKLQTLTESINSGCPAMLVIVRYRRQLKDAEVWLPNGQWASKKLMGTWTVMYLDEFVNRYGPIKDEMIGG